MTNKEILQRRLYGQHIAAPALKRAADVVTRLGAMQAQDYSGALWAIGLRLPSSTRQDIEQAIAEQQIVRTWPMRGTLHFVAAKDIRWMLQLLTPRVIKSCAARYRRLELEDATFERSRQLFINALQGDKQLTRSAMFRLLEAAGIAAAGQRGIHILCRLCQEGLLCFGAHLGKEPSFALLDEWVPQVPDQTREASLAALTWRYFSSHGPATIEDFAWWSGLTKADVRAGLAMNTKTLVSLVRAGKNYWLDGCATAYNSSASNAYLLPGFDEYMLGYTDRSIALDTLHSQKVVPGNNGMFLPTTVIDGKIEGLWKRVTTSKKIVITLAPFTSLSQADIHALQQQGQRYGEFMGSETTMQA